jgi:hypothetical protein
MLVSGCVGMPKVESYAPRIYGFFKISAISTSVSIQFKIKPVLKMIKSNGMHHQHFSNYSILCLRECVVAGLHKIRKSGVFTDLHITAISVVSSSVRNSTHPSWLSHIHEDARRFAIALFCGIMLDWLYTRYVNRVVSWFSLAC